MPSSQAKADVHPVRDLGPQPFVDLIVRDGRSCTWVADRIGIIYAHISQVGRGRVAPSPELIQRLVILLGRPAEELFTAEALATEYRRTRRPSGPATRTYG